MFFLLPTTTMFIHYTTVYEAGREHWYGKEGCTNHRYVASTPRTSGLCWLPSCSHPQSRVLIFSALFLTIWSIRVIGTRCITDLSLCVRVCACMYVCVCICIACFAKWAKSARSCLWIWQRGALILSAFAFSCQPRILLLALYQYRCRKQFIVFPHSAVLDLAQWLCSFLCLCRDSFFSIKFKTKNCRASASRFLLI